METSLYPLIGHTNGKTSVQDQVKHRVSGPEKKTGKATRATKVTKAVLLVNGESTKRVIVASLLPDADARHGKLVSSISTTQDAYNPFLQKI